MTDFVISQTDAPPDDPPTDPPSSDDPVCRHPGCGAPLIYGGRGRRPVFCDEHKKASGRTSGGTARAGSDVQAAMDTLGYLYSGISAMLVIVAPTAASVWAGKIDGLQAQNAQTLAADKALCKSINRLTQKSARGVFVGSHLIAIAPVVAIARTEMSHKAEARKGKRTESPAPQGVSVEDVVDAAASAPQNGRAKGGDYGNGIQF